MNDYNEVDVCKGESTPQNMSVLNSSNSLELMYQGCKGNHHPDLLIPLDQTTKFFSSGCEDDYYKFIEIEEDIKSYIQKLKNFKVKIIDIKQEIIQEIEAEAELNIQKIDNQLDKVYHKLEELNQITAKLAQTKDVLTKEVEGLIGSHVETSSLNGLEIKRTMHQMINLDTYTTPGEEEFNPTPVLEIEEIVEIEEINSLRSTRDEELQREVQEINQQVITRVEELELENFNTLDQDSDSFSIKSEIQSSRYLFSTKNSTKEFIKYDIELDSITKYNLSQQIGYNFIYSSSCILPNGQILIAGGYSPYQDDTYRIDVSQELPRCTQLGSLNTLRSRSKLICHRDTVYILGGTIFFGDSSPKAERMAIQDSNWESMPDMKEPRYDFGVYIEGDRIYLIGGRENTSIEYYDVSLNRFYLLPQLQVPTGGIVSAVIDQNIYTIGQGHWAVYSKDFELVESEENLNYTSPSCYSDVIVKDSKLVYISSNTSKVLSFDVLTHIMTIVKQA